MSATYDKIIKGFARAIKESIEKGTSPYDTTAEVLRVDGDTAWVHIVGGVDETPVKKTIDCKAGDTVQVRVGGGRAWITGNATAPPTDDTKAKEADNNAKTANKNAIHAIKTAEAEADGRKLLIRQVADGIEIGFENSQVKALINGEGSFDVINEDGTVLARMNDSGTFLKTPVSETNESQELNLTPYGVEIVSRDFSEEIVDVHQTWLTGGKLVGSTNGFWLSNNVTAPYDTPLWYGYDMVETPGLNEEYINQEWYGAGYVTTGRTEIKFTIPLNIPVIDGSMYGATPVITCEEMYLTVRQNGNYLVGSASDHAEVPNRCTAEYIQSGIYVTYTAPSAISGATNNDTCGISCECVFSVTWQEEQDETDEN